MDAFRPLATRENWGQTPWRVGKMFAMENTFVPMIENDLRTRCLERRMPP